MVSALGAAVGAIAAAVGAIAAWRAAVSRDALEARAVGIRPVLTVRFTNVINNAGTHRTGIVQNESEWPASDLVFEMRFSNGTSIDERTERLAPPRPRHQPPDDGE